MQDLHVTPDNCLLKLGTTNFTFALCNGDYFINSWERRTISTLPSGHLISSLSTFVAAPNPKCSVMSFCEQ